MSQRTASSCCTCRRRRRRPPPARSVAPRRSGGAGHDGRDCACYCYNAPLLAAVDDQLTFARHHASLRVYFFAQLPVAEKNARGEGNAEGGGAAQRRCSPHAVCLPRFERVPTSRGPPSCGDDRWRRAQVQQHPHATGSPLVQHLWRTEYENVRCVRSTSALEPPRVPAAASLLALKHATAGPQLTPQSGPERSPVMRILEPRRRETQGERGASLRRERANTARGTTRRLAAERTVVAGVRQRFPLDERLEVALQNLLREAPDDLLEERTKHGRQRGFRGAAGGGCMAAAPPARSAGAGQCARAPGPASGPGRRGRQSAECRPRQSRASRKPTSCCRRSSSRS